MVHRIGAEGVSVVKAQQLDRARDVLEISRPAQRFRLRRARVIPDWCVTCAPAWRLHTAVSLVLGELS